MKRWLLITLFTLLSFSTSYAQDQPLIDATEVDASPDCWVYKIIFSNGSVTCNGDGTVTVNTTLSGHDAVTLDAATHADDLLGLSTQVITLDSQTANYLFAGPTTGAAAAPTFRAMVTADLGTALTPRFAQIGIGEAADTNQINASGFHVDADGDVTAKSLTISKSDGVAGTSLLYEANSTDTNGTGWKGPASVDSDLYLAFPTGTDHLPTADQFLLFGAPSGDTSTAVWKNYGYMREVNGSAHAHLTAADVSGTTIYNYGQAAADVVLILPTAAAGYNFIATVGTAQSNHWGVQAAANDKIYLLNADGTISAGSDAAAVVMTAAQVGQVFACWTFKTDAYDWMCKATAFGTSTFAAHAGDF